MTITTDSFGNTFEGSASGGEPFTPQKLLAVIRAGLGSDDRANLNFTNQNFWRIDFRPNENTTDETKTGVVGVPQNRIDINGAGNLQANARMAFSPKNNGSSFEYPFLFSTNLGQSFGNNPHAFNSYTSNAVFWAVVRDSGFSALILEGSETDFWSAGILENSSRPFPNNLHGWYDFTNVTGTSSGSISGAAYLDGSTVTPYFMVGATANYNHVAASDSQPTTDAVETYARLNATDASGFIPNIIKVKESEITPGTVNPGLIVNINFDNATGFYAGQGTRKAVALNRVENNQTGDYRFMIIAD